MRESTIAEPRAIVRREVDKQNDQTAQPLMGDAVIHGGRKEVLIDCNESRREDHKMFTRADIGIRSDGSGFEWEGVNIVSRY